MTAVIAPEVPTGFDEERKLASSPQIVRDAVVKSADMPDELQKEAIEVAQQAMNMFKLEKDMAAYMKEEFDRRHYPSWHCVVGRNFGSFVTHETNRFIYFYIAHVAFMLYKTGF